MDGEKLSHSDCCEDRGEAMAVKEKSSSQKSFTHSMQDLAQEYMLTHNVETIEL